MISIKNRWAFITGASRGIGYLSAIWQSMDSIIFYTAKNKQGYGIINNGQTRKVSAVVFIYYRTYELPQP